jgi:Protein of unknown function (DUF2752).
MLKLYPGNDFMRKNIKNQEYKNFLYIILVIFLICGLYYILDINCIIRYLIGVPCPGCGMSRAIFSLFRGNIAEAFYFHPLFPLVPFILLAVTNLLDNHKKIKKAVIIIISVSFISIYIIRMYLYFPDTQPMVLNENAVIFRLIKFFAGLIKR